MSEMILELAVGDVLQVGECQLTVVAVETDEVTFRIDEFNSASELSRSHLARLPLESLGHTAILPSRPR